MVRFLAVLSIALFSLTSGARAELIWGVNGHPFNAYPGISYYRQVQLAADLGTKLYRVNITQNTPVDSIAELLDEGSKTGVMILPVLTPEFDLETSAPEDLYKNSFEFAASLATRFGKSIRVWELGNEMENYAILQPCEMRDDGSQYPCDWGPAGGLGKDEYFGPRWKKVSAVLKGMSDGVYSVDPALQRAIGTAGWGHLGAFERMRDDHIEWDISVWHMYGQDPEWAFKTLSTYGKPIWVTEFNHPYGSRDGEADQALGLAIWMKRLADLAPIYNVESAIVYELLDETYWAPDYEAMMGLVRLVGDGKGGWQTGFAKPAYHTVRELIRGPSSPRAIDRKCNLEAIGAGPPSTDRIVRYAYCLILERDADPSGLESWTQAIDEGTTIKEMVRGMVTSGEFDMAGGTFAMTDEQYLSFLYTLLLGKSPIEPDRQIYLDRMRAGALDRYGLAVELVDSSDFRAQHPALVDDTSQIANP